MDDDQDDLSPPPFLSKLEAMGHIYRECHPLVSRKTKELLEGPDLQELLDLLDVLRANEKLVRREEARLARPMLSTFGSDSGPILTGLNDARLWEPWRLFLLGWDIWRPKGWDRGVELFWEGEAEDDDGNVIEVLQSLHVKGGEIGLSARVGSLTDALTFDGQAFYRLGDGEA